MVRGACWAAHGTPERVTDRNVERTKARTVYGDGCAVPKGAAKPIIVPGFVTCARACTCVICTCMPMNTHTAHDMRMRMHLLMHMHMHTLMHMHTNTSAVPLRSR